MDSNLMIRADPFTLMTLMKSFAVLHLFSIDEILSVKRNQRVVLAFIVDFILE